MSRDNAEITQLVIDNVETVRQESEDKLMKSLRSAGATQKEASDIAFYFFGHNPKIKELTEALLKDLNITK
jgi:hypothetical protein